MVSPPSVSGYVFVAVCCCYVLLAGGQRTHPSEVHALRSVRRRLIDPMKNLRNWNEGDPCTSNWTGVVCLDEIGADGYLHVRQLLLMNMNLSGTLAAELHKLSHLEILDFTWNKLIGSIPNEIGRMTSLLLLLLNGNKLSGSLPAELGHLSNLNRFQIDQNDISGPIPKSFSNLTNVKHFHFNNNSISGEIPVELSYLTNILHLLLDNNNLSGNLPPQLSALPNLRILQLDNNNFSGSNIPAAYGNFSRLLKLSLRNCSLDGVLPDFSGITNLSYLDLSQNHLRGSIPPAQLSKAVTTIDLSNNKLNGSIPESFSDLPSLQTLSLNNNSLSGSVPDTLWQNIPLRRDARLTFDLRNNSLSHIQGDLDPPKHVTLRLDGNPVCKSGKILNIGILCGSDGRNEVPTNSTNSTACPSQACPTIDFYDYVPASPVPCFCAAPLRIGYRLKSPSFSYFHPYIAQFEDYVTGSLGVAPYQLWIDSFQWEEGPRLRMHLKIFPTVNETYSRTFNTSEVLRIRNIFTSWRFPGSDFFGPYELLNFTLLGPYSYVNFNTHRAGVSRGVIAAIVAGAVVAAVALSAIATTLIFRRNARSWREVSKKRSSSKVSLKIDGVKDFSFRELAQATDNFNSSTMIGCGGYGKVYRGILSDETVVAIKRADEGSLQGEKEFLNEIELLSRLHHRNLVLLIGYCDEEGEQMLVYEFMPNGSLREWLSGKANETLSFGMRLRIAFGAAKGILYLHTEADPPVFHRDIKSGNILLDSKLNAKVADFGLSRLAPVLEDEDAVPKHVSTVVRGTPGYLDPEYFLTHQLTDKSDVYSLGVVFLELLTGMHPISRGKNIVREVKTAHQTGMISSLIDKRMGPYALECSEKFMALGLRCCDKRPEIRPTMSVVVKEVERILQAMPEAETKVSFSETGSMLADKSSSPSSSGVAREEDESLKLLGSDLRSGVVPAITPR